jgi:hypothetical protein
LLHSPNEKVSAVVLHSARPPQLSRPGYHPSDPRWAAVARFDRRKAHRALTSAACLARSADHARLCLSPIRIQRSAARLNLEKARLRWDQRGSLADNISGTAVLEYGPTEILPPLGAISVRPARLCRPDRHASYAYPRGKPGFSTCDSEFGRETDSPLEGEGFEPSVPRKITDAFESAPRCKLPQSTPSNWVTTCAAARRSCSSPRRPEWVRALDLGSACG